MQRRRGTAAVGAAAGAALVASSLLSTPSAVDQAAERQPPRSLLSCPVAQQIVSILDVDQELALAGTPEAAVQELLGSEYPKMAREESRKFSLAARTERSAVLDYSESARQTEASALASRFDNGWAVERLAVCRSKAAMWSSVR